MNNRIVLSAIFVVCFIAGSVYFASTTDTGSGLVSAQTSEQSEAPKIDTPESTVTVDVPDLILGDENAPVELIEYASYTCPHCANFHTQVMPELKSQYIDTGKVKLVYREVFFDRVGLWAAMVARCGGDTRYFGIQKMLYDTQADWLAGGQDTGVIVENLRTIGKKAGLTDADLDACFNDGDTAQAMVAKFEAEMEEYNVSGTPTLILNGQKHSNMTFAALSALIEEELAE